MLQQVQEVISSIVYSWGRWEEVLTSLTEKFWPNYGLHPWAGPKYVSDLTKTFSKRVQEIQNIRNTHQLLIHLLSPEEQRELHVDDALLAFEGAQCLQCDQFAELSWKSAVMQYNTSTAPIEQKVATKLRSMIATLQTHPSQLLREFQRYGVLVQKESISRQLAAERETLISYLTTGLQHIQSQYKERRSNMEETDKIMLSLARSRTQFHKHSALLADELQKYKKELFSEWLAATESELKDGEGFMALRRTGRMMDLDYTEGKLKVNFDDNLIMLLREVRQLVTLGLPVPAKIQQMAESAQQFYRHAIVLKQVAHFYNTIDQQMLPCQQAMLLEPALAFERLVKAPQEASGRAGSKTNDPSVIWKNPAELESYITKIQAAAEKLTSENRKLRKYHNVIADLVTDLFSVDLLRNQAKWKDILNTIRSVISQVEQRGVSPEDTLSWRNHWDYQIYKALEYQYQLGLENMNETLPDMKVDLVFKTGMLQFRPPFEEIRARYYREMKKFINIPSAFRGVGEGKIFAFMSDSKEASASLAIVYHKAELLFQNLMKVTDLFKDWVVLGMVDLNAFIEEALGDVSDWEFNFRMLKSKGKDAEQLPTSIQVDCISVSTVPVKAAIDDQLQRLFDSLIVALRKAIVHHISTIESFVNRGMEVLSKRPENLSEISDANVKHEELSTAKAGIRTEFEAAETKNKLLKSVAGVGVDMLHIQNKWSKLELMLESHELMIKEQVEVLRNAIESRKQSFVVELEKFSSRWHQLKPNLVEIKTKADIVKALEFVKNRKVEFEELIKNAQTIKDDCVHFNVPPPEFSDLEQVKVDIEKTEEMWALYSEYSHAIEDIMKEDWISFRGRTHVFEDLLGKWAERIRSRETDAIASHIQQDMDSYRDVLPCFKYLRGDAWTSEHWGELFHLCAIPKGVTLSELTFGHIIKSSATIVSHIDQIKELNNRANGEIAIREAIQELDIWGTGAMFAMTDYRDVKGEAIHLIKDWKDLLTQVGDNQSLLQSLKDSPYFKSFADKASSWERKLAELDHVLRHLNTVQRKWVYLEPIFSRGALPSEQQRFTRIDEDFRSIMASIQRDGRVVSIISIAGVSQTLETLVDQLDRCQKALNEFLEEKRAKFARFYFIGDEDLLEILGQAKNPNVIQAHLKKLFAGVHTVEFDEACTSIRAMRSVDGEHVRLNKPVAVSDDVEEWLEKFAKEMKSTLRAMLQQCLSEGNIFKYPSQILGLAEYIHFTSNCEKAITKGALSSVEKQLKQQLEQYTTFNIESVEDKAERKVVELKLKSLILDIIHHIDVLKQLQDAKVTSLDDWIWLKQLRFYMGEGQKCSIRMNDAQFEYTYEYQGIPPKLVHTPLTDKCYLTLTQAMAHGFGGNPFGPAGTGKTESVKALGVLFGRQVLVFNCDEGIDYKSMGRIFVGLVKCGAWGCFDEFNRLDEAVLSAVSQQIQVIQAGLKSSTSTINLLGKTVDLDKNSAVFVTLNPAGKGYGGRQKLPDNLKQLFRSVAMTHPDNELIAETILFSEGFHHGKQLGVKFCAAFTLCKQLLSAQQHYEWGLRPLKTTLWLAGQLLQEEKKRGPVSQQREYAIAVKALRVNTLSKLTFTDSERFNALIKDIFPNVPHEEISYDQLAEAVKATYAEMNLLYIPSQAEKIFQFYEACRQRMGVVIVGPSGSGKTTLWKILKSAWQKCGQSLKRYTMNPKAIDRTKLLGQMDIDTREWFDGILTYASRQAVKEPLNVRTWIICDGDVDPEWVESLNSVLDDNRLLTMPNGERIQFGANVNFIFETHNLKYASPATVSRMGMIHLSDETLDAPSLVKGWLSRQAEGVRQKISGWIQDYFFKGIEWIVQNGEQIVDVSRVGLVLNGLSHLKDCDSRVSFIYGLIRGMGANLGLSHRVTFAQELFKWANERPPDPKKIIDFWVDKGGRLQQYQIGVPSNLDASKMLDLDGLPVIETVDVRRTVDIILPWLSNGQSFLLVGPEGAGKNMILRHCFSQVRSLAVATINCSAQTRSSHILQRLEQACMAVSTNTGRVLRPKETEKLVLYLKDINLPKPDKYETVELVQLLQQLLTYRGYYDANLEWVSVDNVQIVASMNPSNTVGRHELSTRFSSILRQCYISYPDREQLQSVYRILAEPIIGHCLAQHPTWALPKNVQKLANTMVNIYDQTFQKFTLDMQPHYLFTPRDLSRWIIGLARYQYQTNEAGELLDTLVYEALRLFQDRLVGTDARQKFHTIITNTLRADWNHQLSPNGFVYSSVVSSSSTPGSLRARILAKTPIDQYKEKINAVLHVFERDIKELNLILFPESLDHLARVERVLCQPGASMLLAGRPGVGRSSAVEIISHMLGLKVYSLRVGRNYNIKSFSVDLKQVLQFVGIHNEEVVLLIEDYQLVDPALVEYVNSLLSGGEIPGLYSHEELDTILNSIKSGHSEDGFRGTLFEYFVSRIKRNLHVVLILDCDSPSFVARCQSNPAFVTRCHFEWTDSWSRESMAQLAYATLGKNQQIGKQISNIQQIIQQLLGIHNASVASRQATPRGLNEFVATYARVFCSKLAAIQSKQKYLQSGLSKLIDAAKYVDTLSAEARKQGAELAEKQKQADQALKQITDSMMKASDQKKEMETLSVQLREEEEKMTARKAAIEKELADVEPIVRQAKAAVGEIKPESLSEVRSLRAPPAAIRDVLEGVLRLMGTLDMSWNSMKGFLGKRTVKEEIMNFDARNISKQVRDSVQELINQKRDSFDHATIKRVSVAAAPLAMWVKANLQYSTVLEKIGPLEADLARLTKSLEASKARLQKLKDALAVVDQTVAALRDDFGHKTREVEVLRASLDKSTQIIKTAQGLLEKLSGEGKRWSVQAKGIQDSVSNLPTSILLASGFINYLGGASEDIRAKLTNDWKKGIGLADFNFLQTMSTESEQLVWKQEGLPSDTLSLENAIVILNSKITPLIIDPAGQATAWLKTHLADKKPEMISQQDDSFLRSLELAVRFGKTLIVQELEVIEPVLYPLLRNDFTKQGPRYIVQFGDKAVDYNENFRLFLVTRKANFTVPSDAVGLLTEVNFTVTRAGLAGQLLGITIQHEKPELEVEKMKLLRKEDELKLQLSALEESLLRELANSEGNILENKSLIDSLNETKAKSTTISQGLQESHKLQQSLDAERDKFAPLSRFGSALYFVIGDLKKINNMYQFSLTSFLKLFEQALRTDASSSKDATELRVKILISTLEKLTFRYISRSIFKEDRQMFALHLVHELHRRLFEPKEWELFTGQIVPADNDEKAADPLASWVPTDRKLAFSQLQSVLPNIAQSAQFSNVDVWGRWIKSSNCEQEFPQGKNISPFQKLLIIQALRPDRLATAMNDFCCSVLSLESLAPPVLNIKRLFQDETSPSEPILLITTPGADPSQELRECATKENGVQRFTQIAMGQGQGDIAIEQLRDYGSNGGWLCLQNIHLVTGWLPLLEKELSSIQLHSGFRLWLTSEAHTKFPPTLLQRCLKITIEAPPGVKKNLQRIYEGWSPETMAKTSALGAQALFALAWFHAVIQERRSYVPQGWNKFYEFSAADLRSTADLIGMMCRGNRVQWPVLHGLLENAVYGGRIDDRHDILKMKAFLSLYFNDEVFVINGRQPSRKLAKGIVLPASTEYSAYVKVISELPEANVPVLMNLPANIDRTLQRNISQRVVAQLKLLRQVETQHQYFERERWVKELTPFLQLWKKLNTGNDLLQKKMTSTNDLTPIPTFFSLEMSNALNIARKIHADLSTISKVLRGSALVSNDISVIATSLMRAETPASWSSCWEGPEDASDFMRETVSRAIAVCNWREKSLAGNLLSQPIQLSNLFNPITFLNALRQQTARKVQLPMDELKLVSTWGSGNTLSTPVVASIEGLYLQGCNFDGVRLSEASANDPSFVPAPVCHVAWVSKAANHNDGHLEVPLYATPSREQLVATLQLPSSSGDSAQWILAGVALLISTL
ncbi:Cytoplasmic dynein 2 heavy chain 1 [Quaeritorhiza haematococci]|nr:Cytoplasmic dynein 2 heavy chain 1 [Quaeritorhiza haematococci]